MVYNEGDFIIGNFIPSKVVDISYSQKEVTVTCASLRKADGSYPIDEVIEAQALQVHGYDNSNVLQGGTVLQSFSSEDILIVTDGFESFIGAVIDVTVPEDQFRDDVIVYQIKIAHYIPPKESVGYSELPDGDETIWDDDWELGYERYESYGENSCVDNSTVGKYVAGHDYDNVNVYNHEHILGQPYDPDYGYLEVPLYQHQIPYNLKGHTVAIDLGETYSQIILDIGYGGQGTPVIGEFGEVTYAPAVTMPDATLTINGVEYMIPWKAGESTTNIVVQKVVADIDSDHLVISVDTDWVMFTVQSISPVNGENYIPSQCTEEDNFVPPYGGMSSFGASVAANKLEVKP